MKARATTIEIDDANRVSALLLVPPQPRAAYLFAHGAGAGMAHVFMASAALGLAERAIATLRFQFPYMERGSKRPDPPALAQSAVRAAAAHAARALPDTPLFAGGKSFGGRMTSQAQAADPLPGVRGLAFFGFPLHPAGQPSDMRGKHLADVRIPMLFLQGTRDALADRQLLEKQVARLGERATLVLVEDADHSFHVPAKSGRKDPEVLAQLLDDFAAWVARLR